MTFLFFSSFWRQSLWLRLACSSAGRQGWPLTTYPYSHLFPSPDCRDSRCTSSCLVNVALRREPRARHALCQLSDQVHPQPPWDQSLILQPRMTSNSRSSCLDHDQLLSDFEITSPFCIFFSNPFPSIKLVSSAWLFRTLILIYRVIAQLQNRKWSQLRLLNYVAAILTFDNSKETSLDPVTDWPARTCWCCWLLKEILSSQRSGKGGNVTVPLNSIHWLLMSRSSFYKLQRRADPSPV